MHTISRGKMNKNVFGGKWKQIHSRAKVWWGKRTDNDLEKVGSKFDKLIGLVQEKFGYTQQQAREEFNQRLKEVKTEGV
jgi:uncharacterized protein YjbJ (UPF0337 family)